MKYSLTRVLTEQETITPQNAYAGPSLHAVDGTLVQPLKANAHHTHAHRGLAAGPDATAGVEEAVVGASVLPIAAGYGSWSAISSWCVYVALCVAVCLIN